MQKAKIELGSERDMLAEKSLPARLLQSVCLGLEAARMPPPQLESAAILFCTSFRCSCCEATMEGTAVVATCAHQAEGKRRGIARHV